MIVDPDFLDHWRTQMLADLLDGDQLAPVYIIRLWSHCQNRRDTKFSPMPAAGLKAICRYQGDADQLEAAMVEAGFIERNGAEISVPKWADYNSQLMANWENGRRGGRPKKTHSKPTGNPSGTHQEPKSAKPENGVTSREPSREEKRREDQIREEDKEPPTPLRGQGGDTRAEWANRIYQAYPRKVRPANALKAIEKALKRAPPDILARTPAELLELTQQFAAAVEGADQSYVPHPATWFNAGGWGDDPDDWARIGRDRGKNQQPGLEGKTQQFTAW